MSHPRPGDRVRIVVEGVVAPEEDGVPHAVILGTSPDHLPLINPEIAGYQVIEPVEGPWQTGDVVRDDEDYTSPDLWVWYGADAKGGAHWSTLDGVPVGREKLPVRLKLVARGGHPVHPELTDEIRDAAFIRFEDGRSRPYGQQETGREAFDFAIDVLLAQMGMPTGRAPF